MRQRREVPWLDRRGERYYVKWYDPDARETRRLSLGTTDPDEAKAKFAAFLAEGEAFTGRPEAGLVTVESALKHYMLEHAREKLSAAARQQIAVDHLIAHFGDLPVSAINDDEIAAYREFRRSVSSGTQRRELSVLQAAIHHEKRRKRLAPQDVPFISLPQPSAPRERWLDKAELAKLFEIMRPPTRQENPARLSRLYRFTLLAYYTASRRDALERLTWFQVDLERQRIKLSQPGERRTTKRRPVLPISPALLPVLHTAYRERQSEFVLDRPTPLWGEFKKRVRKAGMGDVTPHTLRHTRAVHLAQDGISLYAIAGLLGDTMATVERNYLHHCPDHLAAVLAADEKELTV